MNRFINVLKNERGSAFIENGLWIIVVVLLVAGAGLALANDGIKVKFDEIKTEVGGATVPDLGL